MPGEPGAARKAKARGVNTLAAAAVAEISAAAAASLASCIVAGARRFAGKDLARVNPLYDYAGTLHHARTAMVAAHDTAILALPAEQTQTAARMTLAAFTDLLRAAHSPGVHKQQQLWF